MIAGINGLTKDVVHAFRLLARFIYLPFTQDEQGGTRSTRTCLSERRDVEPLLGALAITLAAIGIDGVASYGTTLRTRELGIRIALGADRRRIRALVLRQGSTPVALGLVSGLIIAGIASSAATAFLRGVPARGPLTYTTVALLLAAVALVATWIPARRAARLHPITALRQD